MLYNAYLNIITYKKVNYITYSALYGTNLNQNKMKWKGFNKLTVQIVGLFAITIMWNFITDTQFYIDNFMWKSSLNGDDCPQGMVYCKGVHYHWNIKGMLFFFMSVVLFILQTIRIGLSHKESDFSNKK